jgi:hypothetical protein
MEINVLGNILQHFLHTHPMSNEVSGTHFFAAGYAKYDFLF